MATSSLDNWCVAPIRNTKGISLEEISRNTKLKISTLRAIEEGQFDALPGGIYNISYIRQYARAIGADESSLVELYRTKFSATA
jgi:cytoskeletal protein RodZ